MPAFTIVTTSAAQGSDAAEVTSLTDEFTNESEALGYSRRMAEELTGLADQLQLDFDYSNIGLYSGDLVDEDLDPTHASFLGVWVLDDEGPAFVTAAEFRESAADSDLQ
jgi:hypothetical protein